MYRIAGYFRGVYISRISRKHSQSSKIKILKCKINVEEAWFSISIREITFREQELNWLFAKHKRLENNPLYGISAVFIITFNVSLQFHRCALRLISGSLTRHLISLVACKW